MWVLLARFGAWLLGGLVNIMPTLVGQVLISLGIAAITYTGFSASIDWLKAGAVGAFVGLSPVIMGMLALMKVGSCISMLFSALSIRMALQGMKSASFVRMTKG